MDTAYSLLQENVSEAVVSKKYTMLCMEQMLSTMSEETTQIDLCDYVLLVMTTFTLGDEKIIENILKNTYDSIKAPYSLEDMKKYRVYMTKLLPKRSLQDTRKI